MKYSEKLKDPRWQKKRLEIFERDDWKCQSCGNTKLTLHVHHKKYLEKAEPWEYPDELLITYCKSCHDKEKDKILQIEQILKNLSLDYRIMPIYGPSDDSPERYLIEVMGFGRKWNQLI